MFVELSARLRRTAVGALMLAALLHATASHAQSNNKPQRKSAQAAAAKAQPPAPPAPLRDGDATTIARGWFERVTATEKPAK